MQPGRTMGAMLGLFVVASAASAQEPASGAKIYKQAVPSVVWIQSKRDNGLATGSGALVDAEQRLVLTNYHVVGDTRAATVFFPDFRDGQPVPERSYYTARAARLGIKGRVIRLSKSTDLAVIQLDRIPEGVAAIPLAAHSPDPGDTIHSIGNAGRSGALWGYVRGTVRQVYRKRWVVELSPGRRQTFTARIIETDSPTNPGDSGGPLVNDAGQLVGVTQGGALNAQSVSYFIDLSEVRTLMTFKQPAQTDNPADVASEPENKPAAVEDTAAILSADGAKAANALLEALDAAGRPVRVETLSQAPDELKAAAEATPADRRKLFEEYALKQLAAQQTEGAMIVVCMKPRVAVVAITPRAAETQYPTGTAAKAGETLITGLKANNADAAILEALQTLRDAPKPGQPQ